MWQQREFGAVRMHGGPFSTRALAAARTGCEAGAVAAQQICLFQARPSFWATAEQLQWVAVAAFLKGEHGKLPAGVCMPSGHNSRVAGCSVPSALQWTVAAAPVGKGNGSH